MGIMISDDSSYALVERVKPVCAVSIVRYLFSY